MCTWPSGPAWNMHMAWCGRRRTVGIWWGRLWGTIGIQPSILRILLLLRLLLALWVHSPPIFHIWDRLGQSSSAVESGIGRRPDLFFFLINSLVETNLWQGCGWKLPTMKWMGTSYNDAHLSYVFKKKKMKMNENTSWHDVDVYCSGRYLKIAVPSSRQFSRKLLDDNDGTRPNQCSCSSNLISLPWSWKILRQVLIFLQNSPSTKG